MLAGYPDIMLQVLAELRGALIDGAETREQMIELLAAQLTDPTSVQMAHQEMLDFTPQAEAAIELLLREHGEVAEAQGLFFRRVPELPRDVHDLEALARVAAALAGGVTPSSAAGSPDTPRAAPTTSARGSSGSTGRPR